MKRTFFVLFLLIQPVIARADGIIIPHPWVELAIGRHVVSVKIQDQAVVTEIDQTFLNLAEFGQVEGTYVFPLPEAAAISAFSMYVDGNPLTAELLPADEARQIYMDIVRQLIDPALLKYAGRGAYRARIFPIVAGEPKRVQLGYSEVIPERNEIRKYVYPLNTEKFSARPLEVVSITVEITSADPIKNVYSPSHQIEVVKIDDHHVNVVYADEGITPNTDFVLYYSVSRDHVGINMLTYRAPDEEGYYMLLAAPRVDIQETQAAKKRVALVMDRSGSMSGQKMNQAREALKFVLHNLNTQDEFNIFDYSTLVSSFSDRMVGVDSETLAAAIDYAERLDAGGGTNIHEALLTALKHLQDEDGFVNMVLFLTDGLATIGVIQNEEILREVQGENRVKARIFAFGVGYKVNTHLLDRLATENSGTSAYVKPEEDIEAEMSAFYAQVSHPVLSDLALDFGDIATRDIYPADLPDLFKGSQLVQLGRYTDSGNPTVTLSGTANGEAQVFSRQVEFPAQAQIHDFLPRPWATRKIGFLLDQIRLNGENQELVDEIVALSRAFGIITPYTSFLIVEDTPPQEMFREGFTADAGADAVKASETTQMFAGATAPPPVPQLETGQQGGVRIVGPKTFYLRDGIWKDAAYQEGDLTQDHTFGSEDYFDLIARKSKLGPYLAIGKAVIVRLEGVTYRIVTESRLGDFNGDSRVNFTDFLAFLKVYGKNLNQSGYQPVYDLNRDGRVDFSDFLIFAVNFRE